MRGLQTGLASFQDSMMASFEGQCLCGAVGYTANEAAAAVVVCHCTHCRRQGGSAFSVNALFPQSAFVQRGSTRVYHDKGDSGSVVERHFCAECGSPIFTLAAVMPGFVAVKVGTMNDPEQLPPMQEIYCDGALSWVPPIPGTARIGGGGL